MIEWCTKKRMLLAIAILGGLSVLIIVLESRALGSLDSVSSSSDVHDSHPVLKAKLSPGDKCWKNETFDILKPCDFCTSEEIASESPLVCVVSKALKELVHCHESNKQTYRSCEVVVWYESQRFFRFELFVLTVACLSWVFVLVRHKQVDHRMMELYLSYMAKTDSSLHLSLNSIVVLYVIKFADVDSSLFTVNFVRESPTSCEVPMDGERLEPNTKGLTVSLESSLLPLQYCFDGHYVEKIRVTTLPSLYIDKEGMIIVAGLCAVLRRLLKLDFLSKQQNGKVHDCYSTLRGEAVMRKPIQRAREPKWHPLLGFQGTCLSAPAEVSQWTHFCEVEVANAIHSLLLSNPNEIREAAKALFGVMKRFERHLNEPVKMHNIRKRMQDERMKRRRERLNEAGPHDNENIDDDLKDVDAFAQSHHLYAEGPDVLLSDAVLNCLFSIGLKMASTGMSNEVDPNNDVVNDSQWHQVFPLLTKWRQRIIKGGGLEITHHLMDPSWHYNDIDSIKFNYYEDDCKDNDGQGASISSSLYSKLTSTQGSFTRQSDVDRVLLTSLSLLCLSDPSHQFWPSITLDWSSLPSEVRPQLPAKRIERKCQQLDNMIAPVLHIVNDIGDAVIVDFCSGGGHLGLVLAYLLPNAKVVLVENKEQSMKRAIERIKKLGLQNCVAVQSNLDYFVGYFDVGLSLHACGVATDLVMKMCVSRSASFVCSPCCYGSLSPNSQLEYPRSQRLTDSLDLQSYLVLCHTADQTACVEHSSKASQGEEAMRIVDMDRVLAIRETKVYHSVVLTTMKPLNCSPKHNIIVALKRQGASKV